MKPPAEQRMLSQLLMATFCMMYWTGSNLAAKCPRHLAARHNNQVSLLHTEQSPQHGKPSVLQLARAPTRTKQPDQSAPFDTQLVTDSITEHPACTSRHVCPLRDVQLPICIRCAGYVCQQQPLATASVCHPLALPVYASVAHADGVHPGAAPAHLTCNYRNHAHMSGVHVQPEAWHDAVVCTQNLATTAN